MELIIPIQFGITGCQQSAVVWVVVRIDVVVGPKVVFLWCFELNPDDGSFQIIDDGGKNDSQLGNGHPA